MVVRSVAFDGDHTLWDGRGEPFADVRPALAALGERYCVGLLPGGPDSQPPAGLRALLHFDLGGERLGVVPPDPRLFLLAAAAAGCHPSEVVYVTHRPAGVAAAREVGCRAVWLRRPGPGSEVDPDPDATVASLTDLADVAARFDAEEAAAQSRVGVGPHPEPWPADPHFDPVLLVGGDRRNVVDRYRYWREEAIVADLAARQHPFHVAVENWRHDRNIGAVVRNANAFGAAGVHIVGRRRWNRRGAMATDRYLQVHHHPTVDDLADWASSEGLTLVGIDNVDGSVPLEAAPLPERCVLLFGQEGPGLSAEAIELSAEVRGITQYGSTRSVNAGVASGIAMHSWTIVHAGRGGDASGVWQRSPPAS